MEKDTGKEISAGLKTQKQLFKDLINPFFFCPKRGEVHKKIGLFYCRNSNTTAEILHRQGC